MRKLIIRAIVYLDDILLMASLLEDLLMARDTLIFILQHLGFLINTKKSYIEPTLTLEFLGVIPDSGEMTLNLPKEKRLKVQNHCQESQKREASCHDLTTGGPWSMEERKFHINVMELKAAKLAIMSFTLKERVEYQFISAWTTWQPCHT